jgi:23S rRNA (adenine2503-C2)-methyltransferase
MGFHRHLSTGEIVSQFLLAATELAARGELLRNVVLMGMGEPLHNYDATIKAVTILIDQKGLAIGPRFITLSTVGLPQSIRRLADQKLPINLAVSLHAGTDLDRDKLIPINRKWGLKELVESCQYYYRVSGRRIFFEFALIEGKNDTSVHAHEVGNLLLGIDAHVNLIPLNATSGFSGCPSESEAIRRFQEILEHYGIPSTVRQHRGLDINAGCGQLRANYTNNQKRNGLNTFR